MIKRTKYPTKCPDCGENDFESAVDEAHDEELHEVCTCLECGFSWVNVYEFQQWDEAEE
jgi:DNA-directed RNA polymerase subunit M/transcription elongation factor TFIIS